MKTNTRFLHTKVKTLPMSKSYGLVNDNGVLQNNNMIRLAHQFDVTPTNTNVRYVTVDPVPSSTVFQNVNPIITIYLEPRHAKHVKDVGLRFRLTVANTFLFRALPLYMWFERIETWVRGGRQLCQTYPEDYIMWLQAMSVNERRKYKDRMLFEDGLCGQTRSLGSKSVTETNSSENVDLILPLIGIWKNPFLDMSQITQDLEIRLYTRTDFLPTYAGPVTGGAVSVYTDVVLTAMEWVFTQHDLTRFDLLHDPTRGVFTQWMYLECVRIVETGTWLNNTMYTFNLQQIRGLCPFLYIIVKDGASQTGHQRMRGVGLGNNATIDVVTPARQSIFGVGVNQTQKLISDTQAHSFEGSRWKGVNYIYWCDNVSEAVNGVVHGYHRFDGSPYQLEVTFGDAGTAEVHVATYPGSDVANDAGASRLSYDKQFCLQSTNSQYPFDEVVAAAVRDSVYVANQCLSTFQIDFTAAQTAATSETTLTFQAEDGCVSNYVGKPTYEGTVADGAVFPAGYVTSTVRGAAGYPSAARTIEIYAPIWRVCNISPSGQISTNDVL
jgi:hypothetical protein